jgi:crotonobetainyl-CoA:carnitine CoA-transferase CaiB-like acyl-CoA transferase
MTPTGQPNAATFQPLEGIKVLDFSKVLAGPLCTQYLGDMGAEVIKIETTRGGDDTRGWPPFEDGVGAIFLSVNRNKRSLSLDLKSTRGLEICKRLVEQADVVVESFGPGVPVRLGLDYESLKAINPRLVYCSLSGYGTQGPMKEGKGYDLILQAFCGMISITGEEGGAPARSPFSPVDQGTGLHAIIAIMGAIIQRGVTGEGMKLEASLFDTAVSFLGYFLQGFWQRGVEPLRVGSGHESLCPYQSFETKDKPLILGIANDALWRTFCDLVGEPALASDPRFASSADRVNNRPVTVAEVQRIMVTRTRVEWTLLFEDHGIPCSPVHNLGELVDHPHTEASDMILGYRNQNGRDLKGVASPIRVNGERPALRRPPPSLGQHSVAILSELGYRAEEVAALVDGAVVYTGE